MLKGRIIVKKPSKLLFKGRTASVMALCAALLVMSSSAPALIHQRPTMASARYLQAGNVVNVTVSSTGCSPSKVTQTAGQITLKVINQTGQANLAVQFYGEKGQLIKEVNLSQGTTEWSETFNLVEGTYTLVAGHNPNWTVHLIVQ